MDTGHFSLKLVPLQRAYVCIKHFHETNLVWSEKFKNSDGEWCEFKRDKPLAPSQNCFPICQHILVITVQPENDQILKKEDLIMKEN